MFVLQKVNFRIYISTGSLAAAYLKNPTDSALLAKAILALNYWLNNDFTSDDCIDWGGNSAGSCPCGTPGLWNKNWYAFSKKKSFNMN